MKHPCDNYRVDIHAAKFGTCVCGWSRAAHSKGALQKAASKVDFKRKDSEELRKEFVQREKVVCPKFVVDMNASVFGMCVCGQLRADHSEAALAAGDKAKANAAVDSEDLRKKFVQRQKVACLKFEVDMNASTFGVCANCGALRADHDDAALLGSPNMRGRANTVFDSAEVRDRMRERAKELDSSAALDTRGGGRLRAQSVQMSCR